MSTLRTARRTGASLALALLLSALVPAGTAVAAGEQPRFSFRPHCTEKQIEDKECKTYAVRDPQSFQTENLKIGDTLDMDLLIHNPGNASVKQFSAWMSYDPTIFSGSLLEIDKNFSTPDLKVTGFSPTDGYIKAVASSDTGAKGPLIVAAHISLKIVKAPVANTVISFYDATKKPESKTAIIVTVSGKDQNIATGAQSYLFVRLGGGSTASVAASAQSSSVTTAAAPSVSSVAQENQSSAASTQSSAQANQSSSVIADTTSSIASGTGTAMSSAASQTSSLNIAFALVQPQGLRVTTEGSSVFLAWNQLNAGSLLGYNVYYGTVSGKYIQRRSIDKANTTLTVRSLPVGTTYYFAIRGVDANNQESDFSQEVSVNIGNPATSTSPLTGSITTPGKTPGTGGTIAGDTGPASSALLFVALSAIAGLLLAFRRQFTAKHISLT